MQTTLIRRRLRIRASSSPLERHQSNVRKLVKDIQSRREKAEKSNADFLMNIKHVFNCEMEYFKSICNPPAVKEVEVKPDVVEDQSNVIISDSYEDDIQSL